MIVTGVTLNDAQQNGDILLDSISDLLGVESEDVAISLSEDVDGVVLEYTIATTSVEDATSLAESVSTDLTEESVAAELTKKADELGVAAFDDVAVTQVSEPEIATRPTAAPTHQPSSGIVLVGGVA